MPAARGSGQPLSAKTWMFPIYMITALITSQEWIIPQIRPICTCRTSAYPALRTSGHYRNWKNLSGRQLHFGHAWLERIRRTRELQVERKTLWKKLISDPRTLRSQAKPFSVLTIINNNTDDMKDVKMLESRNHLIAVDHQLMQVKVRWQMSDYVIMWLLLCFYNEEVEI